MFTCHLLVVGPGHRRPGVEGGGAFSSGDGVPVPVSLPSGAPAPLLTPPDEPQHYALENKPRLPSPHSTYIQVVPHGLIMYPQVRISRLKKLVGQVVRMLLQVIFQPVFLPEVFSDGLDPCQRDSLSQHWERETNERQ